MSIPRSIALLLAGLALVWGLGNAHGAPKGDELVEWVSPALPSVTLRNEEEKALGVEQGRTEPQPELLQPALDDGLPVYRPVDPSSISGSYKAAASDVLPRLIDAWTDAFQAIYPNVEIELSPPYAGSLGALELIAGNVDFVFVSRELKPSDINSFGAKYGYPPFSIPIVGGSYRHYGFLDALAVLVHKSNPLEEISLKQLDAVFSSTRHRGGAAVETWGDLGLEGDWAVAPVRRFGIEPWNGFEEFFRQRVLNAPGKRGKWRGDVHFDEVVFPVAARVAEELHAIGYTGMAYVDASVRVLPIRLEPGGPLVAPSYENVATALYPLSRLIYFNLNRPTGDKLPDAIRELLRFILSRQGQAIVREHGVFLPLRAQQAAESLKQLD
ncbi:MAG: substrate-binding domain-containing protein [Gammaproteobacteria bacterium]|nr:substrate-binding domain-containing protein [Gammaproteobacteria bacterium]